MPRPPAITSRQSMTMPAYLSNLHVFVPREEHLEGTQSVCRARGISQPLLSSSLRIGTRHLQAFVVSTENLSTRRLKFVGRHFMKSGPTRDEMFKQGDPFTLNLVPRTQVCGRKTNQPQLHFNEQMSAAN